jgi:hypothetical protein
MSLDDYTVLGPIAYRGKKNCRSVTCTRFWEDGKMLPDCHGWHCSYCEAACSSQGHRCDAAEAILGEAARIAREDAA